LLAAVDAVNKLPSPFYLHTTVKARILAMCELDVHLKGPGSSAKVASEVIYAGFEYDALVVRDIVGSKKEFTNTIVSEIDIKHESMELKESPILGAVLDFISAYDECLSTGRYAEDLQDRWEEVKARGDRMVRDLWTKSKKVEAG